MSYDDRIKKELEEEFKSKIEDAFDIDLTNDDHKVSSKALYEGWKIANKLSKDNSSITEVAEQICKETLLNEELRIMDECRYIANKSNEDSFEM